MSNRALGASYELMKYGFSDLGPEYYPHNSEFDLHSKIFSFKLLIKLKVAATSSPYFYTIGKERGEAT